MITHTVRDPDINPGTIRARAAYTMTTQRLIVHLAKEYTDETINCHERSVGVKRGRLVGRVVHHGVGAELATTAEDARAHILAAEVVLDGLKALKAAHGDWSTDTVGRMGKYLDEVKTSHARKWAWK